MMPFSGMFSPICLILVLAGLSGAAIIRDSDSINRTYDYIVVGGGLTGLVVANRLTEDPNLSVLVVEYGDFDDRWDVAIPYFARFLHTQDLFELPSVPQKGLGNRTFNVYLGKTVGGGSTVNGMALSRGSRTDYDSWEALGNPGWGWESMFEYFKKSSTLTYPNSKLAEMYDYVVSPEGYGQGPMQAGFPKWQFPALYDFIDAWTKDIGVQYRTDGDTNGENLGMAWKPIDIDPVNITRSSARQSYYDPVSARANLDILVGNYVATLVTEPGASVRGVNVARVNSTSNEYKYFPSGKEVILATGAVHTTKILQISGIGPAALLEPLGINVIADLPGVGANFQDHPTNIGFAFQLLNEPSLNPNLYNDASFFNASWDEYMANRTGPLTWASGNNRVVLSLENLTSDYGDLIDDFLDVNDNDSSRYLDDWYKQNPILEAGYKRQHQLLSRMIAEQHGSVIENVFGGSAGGAFTIIKPFSRGTVLVNSTNPDPTLGAPLVDYQALTHPLDMKIAIAGVRMARRLLSSPSLAPLRPVETVPGANVTTDEQIEHAIRTSLYRPANAHPCCTAAMMPKDLGGVVDPQLRVYGVTGLRIVDASILPLIPSAHTQETMYAVAEKAADVIKGVGGD